MTAEARPAPPPTDLLGGAAVPAAPAGCRPTATTRAGTT